MKRQDIAVGGILKIDDKLLVIKRAANEISSAGYWEIPKGKVEFGEDPQTALQREFLEEVNLRIELKKPWYVSSHTYARDGVDVHFWHIDYFVELSPDESTDNIRLSEDHDNWKLVDKVGLKELSPMYPEYKDKLLSLFAN